MKRLFLAWGVACAAFCAGGADAQPAFTPEQVKAGFLYHFAAFVNWPDGTPTDPIVIGVLGADEVENELGRIVSAKRGAGRPITIRRLRAGENLGAIHILYVGAAESQRLERVIAAVRGNPTLVVSDTPDGLERGAMVNFVTTERVQFEISLDSTHQGGLRLSPRLLSVAVRIKKSGLAQEPLFA